MYASIRDFVTQHKAVALVMGVLEDAPLLVAFDSGRGRVIYSAFSWKAQSQSVTDLLLLYLAEGLDVEVSHTEATSQ